MSEIKCYKGYRKRWSGRDIVYFITSADDDWTVYLVFKEYFDYDPPKWICDPGTRYMAGGEIEGALKQCGVGQIEELPVVSELEVILTGIVPSSLFPDPPTPTSITSK